MTKLNTLICLFLAFISLGLHIPDDKFIGTWAGFSSLKGLCEVPNVTPKRRHQGHFEINIKAERAKQGQSEHIKVTSSFTCFDPITLTGQVFGSELIVANEDHSAFATFYLESDKKNKLTLSGEIKLKVHQGKLQGQFFHFTREK